MPLRTNISHQHNYALLTERVAVDGLRTGVEPANGFTQQRTNDMDVQSLDQIASIG